MLAMRPIGLRLRHGVDALGNAIGESLAAEAQPKVPGPVSAEERANILKMFEDGPGSNVPSGYYLSRAQEERLRSGETVTDAGAPLGEGPYALASNKVDPATQKAAEQLTKQTIGKAAEVAVERAPQAASKLGPLLEAVAPWLGKLAVGAELLFYTKDAPTTDWKAAGSKFSYNPDDFTLSVTDSSTDVRVAVNGIHNPSQYSDAQYLAYVSYKANGGLLAIDDFASFDPPSMGPVDRASSQKPDWLKRLDAGNAFNAERASAYPYNEVYVNKPSGGGYYRLDSYDPDAREIVSRKFTQFSEITEQTGIDYVKELRAKYPDGATIANVPTNRENGLVGQTLRGQQILEVPVQINPIPQAVIDAANRLRVLIRDINGKTH